VGNPVGLVWKIWVRTPRTFVPAAEKEKENKCKAHVHISSFSPEKLLLHLVGDQADEQPLNMEGLDGFRATDG